MSIRGGQVSGAVMAAALVVMPDGAAASAARSMLEAYEASVTAALNMASLAQAQTAAHPSSVQTLTPDAPADPQVQATPSRPNINPYDRDIQITAPLQFNQRVLGEIPIILTRDDRLLIYAEGFRKVIDPLLTTAAQAELGQALSGVEAFEPNSVGPLGIYLEYDPEQLVLLVLRIDPLKRTMESLYEVGSAETPGAPPADFSAYLNANMALSYRQPENEVLAPSVFLTGAARFGRVVFEADVQGREDFGGGDYTIERQFARFVYDQPEHFRRWMVGDLDSDTRGRQGFAQLGGVGVLRQRQRFDSFRTNILAGGRQLVLQEASTVRVIRNGVFQREFLLDPGQYDLSNLPLDTGSNDIQLEIVGSSGQVRSVGYRAYLDTIDLEPGDYEYGAYFGALSVNGFGQPDYSSGDLAFSGFWRKAFEDRPAVGLGVQLSEDVQNVSGQTQFVLANGARARIEGAASQAFDESGHAITLSYDHFVDRVTTIDSWSVIADYTSEHFTTLGSIQAVNPISWTFSGSYTRQFSNRWLGTLTAAYRLSRSPTLGDSYSVQALSTYRLSSQWSVQAGVETVDYGRTGFGGARDGVGAIFGLVWQPRYDFRGEARYASLRDSASLRFQKAAENRVGSVGYSLAATYDDGPGALSGQVDYIGNRFDASVSHAVFGADFNSLTDQQITTVRLGSSIATAGGQVGIGRNIFDSFALVKPHPSLGDRSAIVGQNLAGGAYTARSGTLGSAVANNLTAYVNQSVRYDVLDPPIGYNVGAGVLRVRPAYRSGYAIEVGSARFVSAVGRLIGRGDTPLPLLSGRVIALDETDTEPQLFFTNSVGRFAIQDLQPGHRYRVELFIDGLSFVFTVPEDNEGLLDLQLVSLPLDPAQ